MSVAVTAISAGTTVSAGGPYDVLAFGLTYLIILIIGMVYLYTKEKKDDTRTKKPCGCYLSIPDTLSMNENNNDILICNKCHKITTYGIDVEKK